MYLPLMDGNIFQIRILNCKELRIKSGTFASLSMLSRVSFTNVEDLILDRYALDFPVRLPANRVRLEFINVSVHPFISIKRCVYDKIMFLRRSLKSYHHTP